VTMPNFSLKGFRTFFLAAAVLVLGLVGKHLQPEVINQYLDLIFAVISLAIVLLRMVTTTPFGNAIIADLGSSPALLAKVEDVLDPAKTGLSDAVANLNSAATAINGHPLLAADTSDALKTLAVLVQKPAAIFTPGADGGADGSGGAGQVSVTVRAADGPAAPGASQVS